MRLHDTRILGCLVPATFVEQQTCLQMEEMMDLVQTGAVHAIDLRQKQEELRETDQNYIQVSITIRT